MNGAQTPSATDGASAANPAVFVDRGARLIETASSDTRR